MKRPLIAITPSAQAVGEEFSDRSLSLSLCYTQAVEEAGGIPLAIPLTKDLESLGAMVSAVDGLVLTGGGDVSARFYDRRMSPTLKKKLRGVDPIRDAMEIELVRQARRRKMPLLGICRGHQVMNVAFGGTLIVDIPAQIEGGLRHSRSDRKDKPVHPIAIAPGSRLAQITGCTATAVNSAHHQAVDRLGRNLQVSARSPDGVIEGIEGTDGSFTIGVQFHPERLWRDHRASSLLFQALVAAARKR